MTSGTFTGALLGGLVFAVCTGLSAGCMAATLMEMFPSRTRYTCVAIGDNLGQTEVLALALSIYATPPVLGGAAGAAAGLNLWELGLGPLSVGVGGSDSAFGVANHSELSVWQLLQALDGRARLGTAYPGSSVLRRRAERVLDALLR